MTTQAKNQLHLPSIDLATEDGVRAYIANTPWAGALVTSLSGGVTNFVYRLTLQSPYKGHETLILKHGKPYAKGYRALEFTLDRQMYEVETLKRVRAWLPSDSLVTVPEVFHFDASAHAIIMEDAGPTSVTLKSFLQTGRASLAQSQIIGTEIGLFLGRMHTWGKGDEDLLALVRGYKQARALSAWVFYGRLVSTVTGKDGVKKLEDPPLEVAPADLEVIKEVGEEMVRVLTQEEHDTFIMGDFWPGNLMVKTDSSGTLERIYTLDWELAKTGPIGMDVGQFASEIHLLRRCHPDLCKDTASGLLENFFKEYKTVYAPSVEAVRGAMVHWGAHMTICGARVDWGGKELSRVVVLEGVRNLVDAWKGDEQWLSESLIATMCSKGGIAFCSRGYLYSGWALDNK